MIIKERLEITRVQVESIEKRMIEESSGWKNGQLPEEMRDAIEFAKLLLLYVKAQILREVAADKGGRYEDQLRQMIRAGFPEDKLKTKKSFSLLWQDFRSLVQTKLTQGGKLVLDRENSRREAMFVQEIVAEMADLPQNLAKLLRSFVTERLREETGSKFSFARAKCAFSNPPPFVTFLKETAKELMQSESEFADEKERLRHQKAESSVESRRPGHYLDSKMKVGAA
jgi:hypothetical protein